MALMTGFLGLAVGAIAGWIASRRSTIPEPSQYSMAVPDPTEEVIDLRDSQLTIELRTDLRKAEARIRDLEQTNAELQGDVDRKNQAVVEARNALRSVRDSLANTGTVGPIPDLGDESSPVASEDVVPGEDVVPSEDGVSAEDVVRAKDPAAEPEQSFDDLHKRLRNVTGELAEVTRRHRGED